MGAKKFLVGGRWRSSADVILVKNPFNGETVAEVCRPGPGDVEDAIAAATEAFKTWKRAPLHQRSGILMRIARTIEENTDELAHTIALEAGKPIKAAKGEAGRAAGVFIDAAVAARTEHGEVLPLDIYPVTEGRMGIVRRFPIGPVAAITPFNFPLMLVGHKYAPAIAAANTLVHKPASGTPLSALLLAEILLAAGLPEGVLNVLPLAGADAAPLVDDPRMKGLTFTGSAEVGWKLKARAPKKKVSLELGGNAAAVVCEDADLLYAADRCTIGGFLYAGQTCISIQRIIVHEKVVDEFLDAFLAKVQGLVTGDPMDEATDVGPLFTPGDAGRIEAWTKEAVDAGGRILCGGGRSGSIVEPTVLVDVPFDAKVWTDEVFGPLVAIATYKDFDEALRLVNDSVYGLQAGVFTSDHGRIWKAFDELEVGGVIAGDMPSFRADNQPYGGVKESGFGREGAKYAIEEMTEQKILIIKT